MEWKRIDGYENYSVSSTGDVRNDTTGRIMKQKLDNGYCRLCLCKNNKKKFHLIHRLVSIAFIPLEVGRDCVDHIDGDKTNNSLTNLRWCTRQENQRNLPINKTNTSGVKGVTFANKKWRAQIRIDGKKIHLGLYETIEEASRARSARAEQVFGPFMNACEK